MAETVPTEGKPETGFLKDICAYFRDFLDTDFKRQSAPKRSVTLKDATGNLTGIDASKYPDLVNEVWRLLRKPIGDNQAFSLAVPRGRYRGRLKTALKDLIDKHAQALSEDDLNLIADRGSATARELKGSRNDPDRYTDTVTASIKADMVRTIVAPLVAKLEGALARARGDAFEAMYNIEEELGERLVETAREPIASALATALVENSFEEMDGVLRDLVDAEPIRQKLETYFDSFATADFFQELHELGSTLKIRENFETYLYIGELRFQPGVLSAFLFVAEHRAGGPDLPDHGGPALYINKKAVDFAAQEMLGRPERRTSCGLTSELSTWSRARTSPASCSGCWIGGLRIWRCRRSILANPTRRKSERSQIMITNALHFGAFDKSDEAMLNDYEELMETAAHR